MSDLTYSEYWTEVSDLAESIASEAMDQADNDRDDAEEIINDTLLHETIDGHQWVIYYAYNLPVLEYSDNSEYADDNGLIGENPLENGLNSFHTMLAFWAMYADVQDKLSDALDEYEANLEDAA